MKKLLLLIMICGTFFGCASNEVREAVQAEEDSRDIQAQRNEMLEEEIDELPSWVIDIPKPDAEGVYAIGMGASSNLNSSMRKARLQGQFGLAEQFQNALVGSERLYTTDTNSQTVERYVALIDKIVDEVQVVGFEVVDQEVKAVNGQFTTYVLMKLPYAEFNRSLQAQRTDSLAQEMTDAFDDLERRLSERREAAREDERHAMEVSGQQVEQRLDLIGGNSDSVNSVTETIPEA
ncbi:hypothetical protein [uncultured Umboniibacter sp.]|uniref:hypothetical protein n=1 Tax=uncultured Umboniibacter sp. TaxID=1798917 RepID=UPI002617EC0E|nr:hypothetical protein [uncultured Umboniibacter sp.]